MERLPDLDESKFGIRAETEKGFGNLQVVFHTSPPGTFKCRIWELSMKIKVMKKIASVSMFL